MTKIKYTIENPGHNSSDPVPIYVSNDAKVACNLIDILVEYIDKRIDNNNYTAKYIWKILYASTHHLKYWVNKHDVAILLDKFEIELKNRKK